VKEKPWVRRVRAMRQDTPPRGGLIRELLIGSLLVAGCATSGTVSDGRVVRWVERAVVERQASPSDKRFDEIGWVTDIRSAIRLGKEYNRPIFLYAGDGRINTGRC
jgi:hypothetical protein